MSDNKDQSKDKEAEEAKAKLEAEEAEFKKALDEEEQKAKAIAEEQAEKDKEAEEATKKSESAKSPKGSSVMACNVGYNGVNYEKGKSYELSSEIKKFFAKNGFIL
jgi:hypothetical protein